MGPNANIMRRLQLMRRKTLAGILTAGLLAGLIPALVPATEAVGSQVPNPGHHPKIRLCQPGQVLHIDGPWGTYILKNNNFQGEAAMCVTHYKAGPNFAVTKSRADSHTGQSSSYPNIYSGCSYNKCSHDSKLPARIFRMHHPWVSYYAHLEPHGKWDANLDMWVSRHKQKRGIVTGAEVMIWFNARGFGSVSPMYKIGGIHWHLVHWITRSPTMHWVHWPLIIFRASPGRNYAHRLPLLPFFRILLRKHLIRRGDWLDSMHAGFEIWKGGKGMKLQFFHESNAFQHGRRHSH
jgi:hypothetical protein